MPLDITASHQADDFVTSTEAFKPRTTPSLDHHTIARPKPESAEQQLLKYMQESNGAFYGHAGTLLNRRHSKS